MSKQADTDVRPVCYRCMKPKVTCICEGLVRVENRTGIYIVQHARERAHALGTARFATLGLQHLELETVFASNGRFRSKQAFLPGTALLYPGSNARALETLPREARPRHLALIDGTWPQASRIYRDSPNLQALPCVTFAEVKPSNYRIRLEPNRSANATIEAVCRALEILEPDTAEIRGLLDCFDGMIDAQLRYIETENPRHRGKLKTYKEKDIPRRIQDEDARLVVACGERAPGHASSLRGVLWTWNAMRLCDNETFSESIAPDPPPDSSASSSADGGARGLTIDEFRVVWRRFILPEDVLVTWDNKPLGRLFDVVGPHPHFVFMKAAIGNLHRGTPRTLDDLIEKEALRVPVVYPPTLDSIAATYLAKMRAAVAYLRRHAR